MIMRMWRGATEARKADAYSEVLERTGVKELSGTPGNRGVWVLRRFAGDRAEFLVLSLWESPEAIRAFAGQDIDKAVFYPEDDEYLVERGPTVYHYEVIARR